MAIAIVGAGVGGLTMALSLHAIGRKDVFVLEAAKKMQDVGVGINLPPHAVRELSELGLAEALEQAGIPTNELSYYDPQGCLIWAESRGRDAGYRWPQYSIHRGRLQSILASAVRDRLGEKSIQLAQRVSEVATDSDDTGHVLVTAVDQTTGGSVVYDADLVIVADGIRSSTRDFLFGARTPLSTNGWVMYRGVSKAPPYLGGRTMVIIGDETQRVVVYPIADGVLNWLLVRPKEDVPGQSDLGNWNISIRAIDIASFVESYQFDWLNVHALIASASEAYAYPMADIDPLPRWVFGRCALLGDAAHAMYPFGSNGASQAILDARILAYELATHAQPTEALCAYENQRRVAVSEVQLANRRQAGDVMARVSAMARRGAHGAAAAELQEVERHYKRLAGFDIETLNNRKSWTVSPTIDQQVVGA